MLKVLLIDDDESVNFLHEYMLKKSGEFDPILSLNKASKALELLAQTDIDDQPDLIFLDINMPGMDGWEFLAEFESLESANKEKTNVVMITSSVNPDDKQKSLRYSDVKSFITKPLNQRILKQITIELGLKS